MHVQVVDASWERSEPEPGGAGAGAGGERLKSLHGDLRHLFETLQRHDIRIAVCTADSRSGTEQALHKLDIANLVDIVVCGDDHDAQPKPRPHNALKICNTLGQSWRFAFEATFPIIRTYFPWRVILSKDACNEKGGVRFA